MRVVVRIATTVISCYFALTFAGCTRHPAYDKGLCTDNLKRISVALQSYHDDYGTFPPPYSWNANGSRTVSWRVLLLPYLDGTGLYELIDRSVPWDHPSNRRYNDDHMPSVFMCPSDDGTSVSTTPYIAICGDKTIWEYESCRSRNATTDNTTLLVVESEEYRVPWMSPYDPDVGVLLKPKRRLFSEKHETNDLHAVFCDGHVAYLGPEVTAAEFHSLISGVSPESSLDGEQ